MKKLLLIDNYDSFTYNLVQYFQELGVEVIVQRNDQISLPEAEKLSPDFLVFSPGPGTVENPKDIGIGPDLFQNFRGKIPILGVCLGHQMIGYLHGGKIEKVTPVHGKRCPIKILNKSGLFRGFDDTMLGMRYHSMVVSRDSYLPVETQNFASLQITSQTDDQDQLVMSAENISEKIFGIQFHPESIGTPEGKKILENFLTF
jgi:anthranilate synthase component 2